MKFKNTNRRKLVFFKTLFIGFLAVFSFSLQAQDTDNQEFWFVAPDASKKHDDRPTFLMITTGDRPATVTISMPKNPKFKQNFTDTVRTLQAYSYWKFEFEGDQVDIVENDYRKSGWVTNKGIQITSTSPVSAYYQIDGVKVYQKEIFTLKGKKAFGDEFYIPFQTRYGVSATYSEDAFRQIQIVATEDDTWVTVDPKGQLASPDDPRGYIDNTSNLQYRRKKLMKGETLLWRAYKRNTTGLTGTRVTADKPIAVTLFEDCLQGTAGSIDPIGDQLVPTRNLGKHYIVIKGYSNGNNSVTDNVVVVAVENDTKVYLDNNLQTTLNAGDYWSHNLGPGIQGKQGYYVNTSKPAYCMHQSAADTEIGGALLPSLYSISGRRITFIKNNSLPVSSMFLVFRDSAKDGFTLDGTPLPLNAQAAGFDDWMYAKVDLKPISGMEPVCTIANPDGSFALGYFNGSSTGTSLYGYLSAFGTFSFGSDTIYHCGNSYLFDAPYALSYEWTLPDNSISTDSRLEAKKSGRYILKVNQDPYLITDETYLKLQNFSHTLNAPSKLLERKSYNFTIELNPQKDKDNYFEAAYEWTFGESASIGTSNEREVEVFYSTPGTKTVSLKIWNKDALCDTTITRTIEVLVTPEVMYWKTDAKNHDWNNEDNWVNAAGEPFSTVPSAYTKVYLPGNAANYPSLTEENTDWSHYGQPEAGEIVFRYGSKLHYQHKLRYEKAYVNYNWGYYNNELTNGQQPSYSWENAKKLPRDTWHILAAPLKSMASGDFSLAGHPFSWQKKLKVTATGGMTEGNFSQAFPTNDIPLAGNNNAIAVKMAGYQNQTGYRQENLEGLRGVVEIPYFENKTVIPYYPAHNYDALSRKSYFYYFDTKTLKLINTPLGSMSRAGEAYRFIYETNQNEPPANGIYEMPLNASDSGNTNEVMIGNPFLAGIDAGFFAEENRDKIDVDQGYKLLSDDGLTWQQKFFTENDTIPAWKAFVVTLKQPHALSLSFPLEATVINMAVVRTPNATRTSHDTDPVDNALYMQIMKKGTVSSDCAVLRNDRNANDPGIRKMILPEGHEVPEIFFTSSGKDFSYLIRNLKQGEKEIPIGVKTSDIHSRLSLEFGNIQAFTASTGAKVTLVDKCLNIRHDLALSPVYTFTQQASGLDRQYVDKNRFVLQLDGDTEINGQDDPENGIDITYRSGILKVTSDESIDTVSVYDLYGRQVFSAYSINLTQYTHTVSLQGKLFVARIKTVSGKVKVKKIMGD